MRHGLYSTRSISRTELAADEDTSMTDSCMTDLPRPTVTPAMQSEMRVLTPVHPDAHPQSRLATDESVLPFDRSIFGGSLLARREIKLLL
jgi:hypothetical protein